MSKKFRQIYKKSKARLVYLITAKDKGKDAWYYILVDTNKEAIFKKDYKNDKLPLDSFGKILYSGWGKVPPSDIKDRIKDEFS